MRERAAREAEARANEAEQEALASNPVINEHPDMQARGPCEHDFLPQITTLKKPKNEVEPPYMQARGRCECVDGFDFFRSSFQATPG